MELFRSLHQEKVGECLLVPPLTEIHSIVWPSPELLFKSIFQPQKTFDHSFRQQKGCFNNYIENFSIFTFLSSKFKQKPREH